MCEVVEAVCAFEAEAELDDDVRTARVRCDGGAQVAQLGEQLSGRHSTRQLLGGAGVGVRGARGVRAFPHSATQVGPTSQG